MSTHRSSDNFSSVSGSSSGTYTVTATYSTTGSYVPYLRRGTAVVVLGAHPFLLRVEAGATLPHPLLGAAVGAGGPHGS